MWQKGCNPLRAPQVSAECNFRSTESVANYTLLLNYFGRRTIYVSRALYSLYNGAFFS